MAKDPTRFAPVDYWLGSRERLGEAEAALRRGDHGLALLLSGVAAEAALRSLAPQGIAFDGRHDLRELLHACQYTPPAAVVLAAQDLRRLWRNNYRYMGPDQVARTLVWSQRYPRRPAAWVLRRAAEDAMAAARIVCTTARETWRSRTK